MKLIITDTVGVSFNIDGEYTVISPECGEIKNCTGCFCCWFKTPGECVLGDGYSSLPAMLGKCTELVIVSRCFYGSVSPFVKNVLDRALSYVCPDFRFSDGVMKHKRRYDNSFTLTVCFYGEDITDDEKNTAIGLMRANVENFSAKLSAVKFFSSVGEAAGELI